MRTCIFCRQEKEEFTVEHVFPTTIGGVVGIMIVCKDCNALLGRNIDMPLSQNKLILFWRQAYRLRRKDILGKERNLPNPLKGKYKDADGKDHYIEFNEKGGLDIKIIPIYEEPKPTTDGGFMGRLTFSPGAFDSDDKVLEAYAKKFNVDPKSIMRVEKEYNPIKPVNINIVDSPQAILMGALKIAYEYACTFIPDYLDDPISVRYANCLLNKDDEYVLSLLEQGELPWDKANELIKKVLWLRDIHHSIVLFSITHKGLFCGVKIFQFLFVFNMSEKDYLPNDTHLLLINDTIKQEWYVSVPYEPKTYNIRIQSEGFSRRERRSIQREHGLKNRNGKILIYNDKGKLIRNDISELSKEILIDPRKVKVVNRQASIEVNYSKGLYFVKHKDIGKLMKIISINYNYDVPRIDIR